VLKAEEQPTDVEDWLEGIDIVPLFMILALCI
jgi:hypothetical protein